MNSTHPVWPEVYDDTAPMLVICWPRPLQVFFSWTFAGSPALSKLESKLPPAPHSLMLAALDRCVIAPFCGPPGFHHFGNSNWSLCVCKGSHDACITLASVHCITLKGLELNSVMSSPVCHGQYTRSWASPGSFESLTCQLQFTALLFCQRTALIMKGGLSQKLIWINCWSVPPPV